MPDTVVAVVLHYDDLDATIRCLESLLDQDYPALEVLVVDNGSGDDVAATVGERFPSVTVHRTGRNRGFAGGMNAGIERACKSGAEYVWLCNDDIRFPEPGTLSTLVERLADPDIGIVTPEVRRYPDTRQTWFCQGLLDSSRADPSHHQSVADPSRVEGPVVYNDHVPLCCALVPVDAWEAAGPLPEPYFVYTEDVEFGQRLRAADYRLATDRSTFVAHEGSGSSGGDYGATAMYYIARNRWLLSRRLGDVTRLAFLRGYVPWWVDKLGQTLRHGALGGAVGLVRGAIDGARDRRGRGPYP